MILIGYARVSTINQNEDRQIQELIKYGVKEKRIYIDKQSGKDFHRPSYMKMLKRLKKGDVLVVKSIDRLGRIYREIQASGCGKSSGCSQFQYGMEWKT